jgi:hypothetical protein
VCHIQRSGTGPKRSLFACASGWRTGPRGKK